MLEHVFDDDEYIMIQKTEQRIVGIDWDAAEIASLKRKIKNQKFIETHRRCCYCQRDLTAEALDVDIEHVLPKSKFPHYVISPFNLSVSCKRCNMEIKKSRTDFLSDEFDDGKNERLSSSYLFIHPVLDNIDSHLKRQMFQDGQFRLLVFRVMNGSDKGYFTKKYFRLEEVEKQVINECQCGEHEALNTEISDALYLKIQELLEHTLRSLDK